MNRAGITGAQVAAAVPVHVLEAVPEFTGRPDWYRLLEADLTAAHLISGPVGAVWTNAQVWASATSDLGRRFLAFITDPRG